jgi:hypothetical protein
MFAFRTATRTGFSSAQILPQPWKTPRTERVSQRSLEGANGSDRATHRLHAQYFCSFSETSPLASAGLTEGVLKHQNQGRRDATAQRAIGF